MDGTIAVGLGLVSWADNKVAAEQTASTSTREMESFREQNMGEPRNRFRLDAAPTDDAAVAFSESGRQFSERQRNPALSVP